VEKQIYMQDWALGYKYKPGTAKVIIRQTANNVFMSIANYRGKVLFTRSGGKAVGHARRHTGFAMEEVGLTIGKNLCAKRMFFYEVCIIGSLTGYIFRAIKGLRVYRRLRCKKIRVIYKIPHNGVRLRLPKRK